MIKKFLAYYRPHYKLFIIDTICSLAIAACNLFYPFVTKELTSRFIPDKNLEMVFIWLGALLVIYIGKAIMSYIVQYWGHIAGVRVQADMRRDFFRHLQRLPFSYFDENKTGSIMSRIVTDLFDVSELAHHGLEDFLTSFVTLIGAFIMMSFLNLYLTLIVFAIVPFMILFAIKCHNKMHDAFKKSREEMAEINASVESSISGIRVSKAYTAEKKENEKFDYTNTNFKKARSKAYKSMGVFFSGMYFFNDLLYLIALLACGMYFFYQKIDLSEFMAFLLYVTILLKPINTIVNLYQNIQDGLIGFGRFQEIMAIKPEEEPMDPVKAEKLKGDIAFNDVNFSYKGNDDNKKGIVLKDLTLHIPMGKTVALVGPSGGGKTTLCHLIPRFYELDSGSITIDGIDIRKFKREDLRKNIGIVAQDVFLFGGSVKDNIAYGDLEANDEQIIEAAKKANIHDYIMSLPDGYESNVGERGVKLSGGQKQRISIARAFLKNPPILILDEATSALDNMTEMQIQASLEKLSLGRTTLVVAHRLSTVKNADEIIVLTKDGVAEKGSHKELMLRKGIYSELYQYQFID